MMKAAPRCKTGAVRMRAWLEEVVLVRPPTVFAPTSYLASWVHPNGTSSSDNLIDPASRRPPLPLPIGVASRLIGSHAIPVQDEAHLGLGPGVSARGEKVLIGRTGGQVLRWDFLRLLSHWHGPGLAWVKCLPGR